MHSNIAQLCAAFRWCSFLTPSSRSEYPSLVHPSRVAVAATFPCSTNALCLNAHLRFRTQQILSTQLPSGYQTTHIHVEVSCHSSLHAAHLSLSPRCHQATSTLDLARSSLRVSLLASACFVVKLGWSSQFREFATTDIAAPSSDRHFPFPFHFSVLPFIQ